MSLRIEVKSKCFKSNIAIRKHYGKIRTWDLMLMKAEKIRVTLNDENKFITCCIYFDFINSINDKDKYNLYVYQVIEDLKSNLSGDRLKYNKDYSVRVELL